MKKLQFLFLSAFFVILTNHLAATTRNVNDATSLSSQYAASVDGDTLNFTANIVVNAAFSVSKSIVFQGNGYTITVTRPGLNDAGVRNSSPSTFRVFTLSGSKTMIFNHLTIKGGISSTTGGAVSIASGTIAKFNFVTISNAESAVGGGGIYNAGTCYLYKSFITRNIGSYGGGIYNQAGTLFMEYSTVTENRTSTTNGGGGIENHSSGYLYIHNSSFSNNQCGGGAGAINNYGGYAFLINSSFTGNISLAYPGGAIYQDNTGLTGRDLTAINCLFAYNYYSNAGYTASSYTLNDINVVRGNANLYYNTYMSNTTLTYAGAASSGVLNYVIGNNAHLLAGDGSTNDIFTGGSLTGVMNGNGLIQGTGKLFQPLLVNVNGQRVPTLKSGSYALSKGCNTRFTNGSGTPVLAYKNMSTNTWVDLTGTSAAGMAIPDDQTNFTRTLTPATGAIERTIDDYIILTVKYAANGTVNGGSVYGEVYPSGTPVAITAIANNGYTFSNWTKDSASAIPSSTESGNPFIIRPTVNTTLTPNFSSTTNFSVTYIGNGNTGGTVPSISTHGAGSTITVASNSGSLNKTNFTFDGWNTSDNGSGTNYIPGVSTYTGSSGNNLVLYANWQSTGAVLVLPVTLSSFYVFNIDKGNAVQLDWASSSENNSSHYEIQRSPNGQEWETIQLINSAGHSDLTQQYSYIDKYPLPNTSYYRIKMVDLDGTSKLSSIKRIKRVREYSKITLFPNPASDYIIITGEMYRPKTIKIFNSSGIDLTTVCHITNLNDTQLKADLSFLPNGLYYVRTEQGSHAFLITNK